MNRIGRTVQIGPVTFKVRRRRMSNLGEFRLDRQTIDIGHKVTTCDLKRIVILHECVHGILETGGFIRESSNEPLVDCLTNGIIRLLHDNPWVASTIMERE